MWFKISYENSSYSIELKPTKTPLISLRAMKDYLEKRTQEVPKEAINPLNFALKKSKSEETFDGSTDLYEFIYFLN